MIKYLAASAWLTLYAPYCWPFLFFMTRTVPAIPLRAANITTIHRTAWLDPPVAGVPSSWEEELPSSEEGGSLEDPSDSEGLLEVG